MVYAYKRNQIDISKANYFGATGLYIEIVGSSGNAIVHDVKRDDTFFGGGPELYRLMISGQNRLKINGNEIDPESKIFSSMVTFLGLDI